MPPPELPPGLSLEPRGLAIATQNDPADPFRGFYVFAAESALELPGTSWEELQELVKEVPAEPALAILSMVQALLWRAPTDQDRHLAIAAELYGNAVVTRLLAAWVRKASNHLVFTEQALVALQRMILDQGKEGAALDEDELTCLRRAILAMASFVDADSRRLRHSVSNPGWLPYLTQVHAYFARDNLGSALGRSWQIFVRIAQDLGPEEVPTHAPLDRWMSAYTGLSIEEQLTLGFVLLASTRIIDDDVAPEVLLQPKTLEDTIRRLGLDQEGAQAAHKWLVSSPAQLAREIGDCSDSASHELVPFNRHPFLTLADGRLLLLSPRAIENWLTSGLYYRLLDAAKAAEGGTGVNRFTAYVGHLVERYVLELVSSAHPAPRLPNAGRVLGEMPYGRRGAKTSDVAVIYPNEVILLEVSSPRLRRPSRIESDGQALRRDLWEIVGKRVKQLTQTIEAIKPRAARQQPLAQLPGVDGSRVARFRPVIVTVEAVHMLLPMRDYLAEHYPNWPGRGDVEPLEIIDLEDLEALLGLVETGHSLSSLLARKQAEASNGVDVGRWLSETLPRAEVTRPGYLGQAVREVLDRTSALLRVERQDWSQSDEADQAA